jgi:hypothetical protein
MIPDEPDSDFIRPRTNDWAQASMSLLELNKTLYEENE